MQNSDIEKASKINKFLNFCWVAVRSEGRTSRSPVLQEIIISNFKACIHAIFAWIQAFSFVFISKMLECYFVRYKNPTKTQHKFSRFVRIFPYL